MKMKIKVPYHIVLFPDGNQGWARERGLPALRGYWEGYKNLLKFWSWCQKRGVKILTVFGFTTENWNRPKREVSFLMRFLEKGLKENLQKYINNPEYQKLGVRVRVIGQKERLSESLQKIIREVEEATKNNNKFFLNLGISYGGKWDIVQATQRIIQDGISPEKVTEELFNQYISTAGLPDPDLIIRAGGKQRLSNSLLWQTAYSELYFSKKFWPDFNEEDLDEAIREYSSRQRTFGK